MKEKYLELKDNYENFEERYRSDAFFAQVINCQLHGMKEHEVIDMLCKNQKRQQEQFSDMISGLPILPVISTLISDTQKEETCKYLIRFLHEKIKTT